MTIANEDGAIIKSFYTGIFPNYIFGNIAKSGNNNYIFVLNKLSENITEISSLSIAHTITLWAMPYAIASNYNGSIVYVNCLHSTRLLQFIQTTIPLHGRVMLALYLLA